MLLNLIAFGCAICLLFRFLYKYYGNELLHPVFFSSIYWISLIGFTAIVSYSFGLIFYWNGLIPILVFWISSSIGAVYIDNYFRKKILFKKEVNINNQLKYLTWILIFFSFLGCLACLAQILFVKIKFNSINELIKASGDFYVLRNSGLSVMPAYGQILIAFLFATGFLGGFYFKLVSSRYLKLVSLLPFLPVFFYTLLNSTKSFLLQYMIIWISSYFSALIYENKGNIKFFNYKVLLRIGLISASLFFLVPIFQSIRYNKYSEETSIFGTTTLSYYSSVNAFTIWRIQNDTIKCEPLKYTLSGIHNIVFNDRESGLYKGFTSISYKNNNEISTNLYTINRGLIEDYTYPGAILLMFVIGFLFSFFYYKVKEGEIVFHPLLAAFISILLYSNVVNIFNYNVIIIGWIIAFLIIIILFKILKEE